jgi:hypothetical protein
MNAMDDTEALELHGEIGKELHKQIKIHGKNTQLETLLSAQFPERDRRSL